MIDVADCLEDYQHRADKSTIADYPMVWAAHYADKLLGEFGVPAPIHDLGAVVFAIAVPFAVSKDITETFVVIDGAAVSPYERNLFVTRLVAVERGTWLTHWVVPYFMSDYGMITDEPLKAIYTAPDVHKAFSLILDRRLAPATFSFHDAYLAGLDQLNRVQS